MKPDPHFTFSKRYREQAQENRLARALGAAGNDPSFIDLTETNPTRVGLTYPEEAGEALHTIGPDYAPEPLGTPRARQAVARYYQERGLTRIGPQDVFLTSSTSEAYAYLFKLFLDPGDSLAVPRPGYPLLEWIARAESVRCRPFSLRRDDRWRIDRPQLERAMARSRLLTLVHPNNPTGSTVTPEDWKSVVKLCTPSAIPVIVDEVFSDYQFGDSPAQESPTHGELPGLLLGGLSKACALPQAKLSWVALTGPREFRRAAISRLEIIADTFLTLGSASQEALPHLLQQRARIQDPLRRRLRSNYRFLARTLQDSPARLVGDPAGWSTVLRIPPAVSAEEVALTLLREQAIHLHPGYLFDFERDDHLVLSLLPAPETFQEGVTRLCRGLRRLSADSLP